MTSMRFRLPFPCDVVGEFFIVVAQFYIEAYDIIPGNPEVLPRIGSVYLSSC